MRGRGVWKIEGDDTPQLPEASFFTKKTRHRLTFLCDLVKSDRSELMRDRTVIQDSGDP